MKEFENIQFLSWPTKNTVISITLRADSKAQAIFLSHQAALPFTPGTYTVMGNVTDTLEPWSQIPTSP